MLYSDILYVNTQFLKAAMITHDTLRKRRSVKLTTDVKSGAELYNATSSTFILLFALLTLKREG